MYRSSVNQNFTMRSFAIIAVALFGCVMSQGGGGANFDQIFNRYAGSDNQFSQAEFSRFWLHFDDNGDGDVSKREFDQGWRQEGFPNPENAPLFFERLDRVADEVLNAQDFPHIFRLFDEDGNGSISEREFRYNWNAYF
ncbi:calmodulin-like [Physella acuta]|uniref:calmodulin-like n=1 Tax=Physella acuta TaxID=109671 RepID=UPI0027DB4CD7|nr:calmodulin-like [Physella acuta]